MPLLRNKFQPYFIDPDSPNNINCGKEYCWPVQLGDKISTQFYQTPCNNNEVTDPQFDDYSLSAEILSNGNFNAGTLNLWNAGASPLSTTLGVLVNGWTGTNPNRVEHVSGYTDALNQTSLALTVGSTYQIEIIVSISTGNIIIELGDGTGVVQSSTISLSGTYIFDLIHNDTLDPTFQIVPSNDFVGYIDFVSLKEKTFDYWDPQSSWILNNGKACWIDGALNPLNEIVPNYILAGKYYKFEVTVENLQSQVQVDISDIQVFLNSNGSNVFYVTPIADGVLKIGSPQDQSDTVCLSDFKIYELKKDYQLQLISSSNVIYDVSDSIDYYEDFVTINLDISTYELSDDCYYLKIYDQCVIESDNLISNGDFIDGFLDWNKNNAGTQYEIVSDQLKLKFYPFSQGATDYVVNGNFTSGSSSWTLGTGWSIVGNKARHTAGNTATLTQTLTLPIPPPPTLGYNYLIKFVVSNWTAGTINCKLSNGVATTSNQRTFAGNDTFIQFYSPAAGGSVLLTFTPSSNFDGDIDDVACIFAVHIPFPLLYHNSNPYITAGTYQNQYEIISSSDPSISARGYLNNGAPVGSWQSTPGVYSYQQSYILNGGVYYILGNFGKTSNLYSTVNYVEGEIIIDNINLTKIEPFEATYQSECIYYSSSVIPKSKLITAYCDQNALGFDFENTGFKLQHRAIIRSFNPEYKKADNYINSGTGNSRIVYGELEKYWKMDTDFASETFHDLMNVMLLCDHFLIGDTEGSSKEYSTNGEEYTVAWNGDGSFNLAVGSVNLRIKNQGQIFNRHK